MNSKHGSVSANVYLVSTCQIITALGGIKFVQLEHAEKALEGYCKTQIRSLQKLADYVRRYRNLERAYYQTGEGAKELKEMASIVDMIVATIDAPDDAPLLPGNNNFYIQTISDSQNLNSNNPKI